MNRLQQIKHVLREHDLSGTGLSRRAIAEKILLRFPESGELKSIESTVQNYLSTHKHTEFINKSRGFWTLMSPVGSSGGSLTPPDEIEIAPISQGRGSAQTNWESGPLGEAVLRNPDKFAQPQPQPPPISNYFASHSLQTATTSAPPHPSVSHSSFFVSSKPSTLPTLGRQKITGADSGMWHDPDISRRSAASTYYSRPSLQNFYSNSAPSPPGGGLPIPSSNEGHQIAVPRSFGPNIPQEISSEAYGSHSVFRYPPSSSNAPLAVPSIQPAFDVQAQSTYLAPSHNGYCPMCARPLQDGATMFALTQGDSAGLPNRSNDLRAPPT